VTTASGQRIDQRDGLDSSAARVHAFNSVIILTPSCSILMSLEENMLFVAFLGCSSIALLVRSECQPVTSVRGCEDELAPVLCRSAQRMLLEDNAGGSSRISEAMSFELLHRAFRASLICTEMELKYWPANGSMTDYSIEIDGICLGVSVTRAMGRRPDERIDELAAEALLRKKLSGILRSSETCITHSFRKQILHIWVRTCADADAVERAYSRMEPLLVANTVVLLTVCTLELLFAETGKARGPKLRCRSIKGAKDEAHLRVLQASDPTRCNRHKFMASIT